MIISLGKWIKSSQNRISLVREREKKAEDVAKPASVMGKQPQAGQVMEGCAMWW